MSVLTKSLVFSQLLLSITGAFELTCDSVNPLVQSDVTCVCKRTSGVGIDWFFDNVFHSNCLLSLMCIPQHNGYSYTINKSENVFEITINSYSYNDCTKVTCKDATDNTIERSIVPSSIVFDATFPTSLREPASNNEDGVISVTTDCISGFLDVEYKWYIIVDGSEEAYTPDQGNVIDTTNTSTCCSGNNGKRTIGFIHEETYGSGTRNVSFKVVLSHAFTKLPLTSNHVYSVKVNEETIDTITVGWWKSLENWEKGLFIVGITFGIIIILIIICLCKKGSKCKQRIGITCHTCVTHKDPAKPNVLEVEYKANETEIILTWAKPDCAGNPTLNYKVTWEQLKETKTKKTNEKTTDEETYTITNLIPGTMYNINVYAVNNEQKSDPWSKEIETRKAKPNKPKAVYKAGATEIILTWTKPECAGKPTLTYEVTWEQLKETKTKKTNEKTTDEETYTIENLFPGTIYKINVYAVNNEQKSDPWLKEIETRKVTVTPEIENRTHHAEDYRIKWTVANVPDNAENFEYMLEYRMENGFHWHKQGIILRRTQILKNLQPETSYKIRVYAIYKSNVLEPPGESSFKTQPLVEDLFIDNNKNEQEKDLRSSKKNPVSEIKATIKPAEIETHRIYSDIQWTVEHFDRTSSKLKYMLEYSLTNQNNWIKHGIVLMEKQTQLKELDPNESYEIRLNAFYESEVLEPPREYQIRTQLIPEIETPRPLAEECEIKWTVQNLPKSANNLKYMLEYCLEGEKDWTKQGVILKETRTCLQSLKLETSYKIRVYAIYASKLLFIIPGESSFKTKGLDPLKKRRVADISSSEDNHVSAPKEIKVEVHPKPSSTYTDIEWKVRSFSGDRKKLKFMLEYSLANQKDWMKESILLENRNKIRLKSLHPYQLYDIRLFAIYESKVLELPEKYQFETKRVLEIKTPHPSDDKCKIEWTVTCTPDDVSKLEYMLEYYVNNEEDSTRRWMILKEEQTWLKNLQPETSYTARIYVVYQTKVLYTGHISFKTKELHLFIERPKADSNSSKLSPKVTIKSAKHEPSSTCFGIEWTAKPFDETCKDELRYMLEYSSEDGDTMTEKRNILSKNNFKFERLLPNTSYQIRVYAIYQSEVLEPPGKYKHRTQPEENGTKSLPSVDLKGKKK